MLWFVKYNIAESYSGGRGATESKLVTLAKRLNAEIDKLEEQSDNLEELGEFLGAVADRLKALQFGIFAARSKKRRDEMVIAVRSLQAGVISVDKEAERAMSNLQEKLAVQSRMIT